MNPTRLVVEWIRARSPDWSRSDQDIADALNAPRKPNPRPRGKVRKPLVGGSLIGLISDAAKRTIYNRPAIVGLQASVKERDRDGVKNWIGFAAIAGDVTSAEAAALVAEVDAMVDDPNWMPEVAEPTVAIGRELDADDVRQSRGA